MVGKGFFLSVQIMMQQNSFSVFQMSNSRFSNSSFVSNNMIIVSSDSNTQSAGRLSFMNNTNFSFITSKSSMLISSGSYKFILFNLSLEHSSKIYFKTS